MIIGFGYKARQGKDTCIQAIIEAFPQYKIKRYAFADELKEEVSEAILAWGGTLQQFFKAWDSGVIGRDFPVRPDWVNPEEEAASGDPLCPYGKHRTLLQWWGTEYRRADDPDYWVERVNAVVRRDNPEYALISDVRFPNEFNWVSEKMKGTMILVSRIGYEGSIPQHLSETALADYTFDWSITAEEGDLNDLKVSAVQCFEAILEVGAKV